MSAFKQLNRQDVYVSDYVAKKDWYASGSLLDSYNIETLRGFSGSTPGYPYPTDYRNNRYEKLVYNSAFQNYTGNTYGTDGIYSGSREVSLTTTLTLSGSRVADSEVGIISLPKDIVGIGLEPNSILVYPETDLTDKFMNDGYAADLAVGYNQYVENIGYWYKSAPIDPLDYLVNESNYVDEETEGEYMDTAAGLQRLQIVDDGEGRLIISGSGLPGEVRERVVGDVIYNQGILLFTDPVVARYYSTYSRHKVYWKSKQPIYTYNVHCTVRESEMNFTYNPSAVTGSMSNIRQELTGPDFRPYVTTIGLYNEAQELVAIGKTNRPIPRSKNIDMTYVVKLDL